MRNEVCFWVVVVSKQKRDSMGKFQQFSRIKVLFKVNFRKKMKSELNFQHNLHVFVKFFFGEKLEIPLVFQWIFSLTKLSSIWKKCSLNNSFPFSNLRLEIPETSFKDPADFNSCLYRKKGSRWQHRVSAR